MTFMNSVTLFSLTQVRLLRQHLKISYCKSYIDKQLTKKCLSFFVQSLIFELKFELKYHQTDILVASNDRSTPDNSTADILKMDIVQIFSRIRNRESQDDNLAKLLSLSSSLSLSLSLSHSIIHYL